MCLDDEINQTEPLNSFVEGYPKVFLDDPISPGFAYQLGIRGQKAYIYVDAHRMCI